MDARLARTTDPQELSDEQLLAASVREPDMFEHLIARYEQAFMRRARHILRVEEDAEDCVQEVFVKMYLNAERFHEVPGARLSSWGYAILTNTALTLYAKKKRRAGHTVELTPEHYESLRDTTPGILELAERDDYVVRVLSKMPEALARVLELHFLRGIPQQEIAAEEGVTVGAIKTRVHRAKAEFRAIAAAFARY